MSALQRGVRGLFGPLPPIAVMAAVLLGTPGVLQGEWAWPRAWVFLAVYGGGAGLGSGLLAVFRPDSFLVRQQGIVARAEKHQPLIDALGLVLFTAFLLGWIAFGHLADLLTTIGMLIIGGSSLSLALRWPLRGKPR